MAQLRPGGMALVIGATYCNKNIGKIVTTIRLAKKGDKSPAGNKFVGSIHQSWLVEGPGVYCKFSNSGVRRVGYGYVRASFLMPIDPNEELISQEYQTEKSPS